MEFAGQKNGQYTQGALREVVEQEPLMLGLMFPQGHGAWTASLVPIETSIAWQYLETLGDFRKK